MTRKGAVQVYSGMARGLYTATWVIGLLATLGGMLDPTPGPDTAELFPGAVFVAAEAFLIIRSLRLGIVIDDEHVISRGILRTRRFPRDSVAKVKATGYSGTINWDATSGYFMMLKLRASGKRVEVPQLIGPPNAVRGLATKAQAALARDEVPRGGVTRSA